ncbi:MAG: efflux RND transporter periplasmic adaptor subunit [Verrucomicrobiae bacterium]|nr:efflux RND transporter periplasmic adaptor subunit [Verrucomicrobiae bacterium]
MNLKTCAPSHAIWIIGLVSLAMVACHRPDPHAPAPPPTVEVMTLKAEQLPVDLEYVGKTESSRIVEIRPQVSGIILKRLFVEGTDVNAGDLLYQIDPAPFQAIVQDNESKVATAQARLTQAESNFTRTQSLLKDKAVSQKDYDDANAQLKSRQADLQGFQATLETARQNLNYCQITAPISGRVGITLVNEGAVVTAQQTKLTDLQQLDPMYVNFTVPESFMLKWREEEQAGRITGVGMEGMKATLQFTDGSTYPPPGRLNFASASVRSDTGSLLFRAEFPNPLSQKIGGRPLSSGQFVRIRLTGPVRPNALVVPGRALQESSVGPLVFTVNREGKVESHPVKTTSWNGSSWIVNEGLQNGDIVIVEGGQKVRPGMEVKTVPYRGAAQSPALASPFTD